MKENQINIQDTIQSLCKICFKNKIEFILETDGDKNNFSLEKEKLILTLSKMDDKKLLLDLKKWEEELKQLFD